MKTFIIEILAMLALFVSGLRRQFATANVEGTTGTHEKAISRFSDAAIARHLLVKQGTDNDHFAVAGAGDIAFALTDDSTSAAEQACALEILGKGATKKMTASEVMATAGVRVYAAAGGKIALAGTVEVGILLTAAAADGDIVEVADYPPPAAPGISTAIFDAQTILAATADNTPAALTIAEQRIVGRITGGNIAALTGAQIRTITDPITMTAVAVAAATLVIPITHRSVNKTTGAGAEALSLVDGAFLGQRLNVNLVVDGGGDGTLTPTTASGFATIVFADAGDFAELVWTTAGWRIAGIGGLTAQPTVTV